MSVKAVAIRRVLLSDFRTYRDLDLAVETGTVVVSGDNGSGKTNLIEAISLFAQGRGLRRSDLRDCASRGGSGGFAVSLTIASGGEGVQFGTGFDPGPPDVAPVRRHRIAREPVASARAFADHLRLVWLTPAMDSLFNGSPGDRRRFLDRLVLAVDAEHGGRVSALERALRQRNRVLEEPSYDTSWLDAIEREVAELAVAIAAARQDTVMRLAALLRQRRDSAFPFSEIALTGEIESLCAEHAALDVEDRYLAMLKASRRQDAAAGRTLVGPQSSDLLVTHGPKNVEARLCSTGEQKALLVGLVLAHARLVADISGLAPVILLDEVAAHFDPIRRDALFADLAELPGQVWMTGADIGAFAPLRGHAQILRVVPGTVVEG